LAKKHKKSGLVGFAALVVVGQQFYNLVLNPMVSYTLSLEYYGRELVYIVQFQRALLPKNV